MFSFFVYLHLLVITLWVVLLIINFCLDETHIDFLKETYKRGEILFFIFLVLIPIVNLFLLFFEIMAFLDNLKYQLWKLK